MPSFPKRQSTFLTLICVSTVAFVVYLFRLGKNKEPQIAGPKVDLSKESPKEVKYWPKIITLLVSATIIALLIFAYYQQNKVIKNYQKYVGKREYTVPQSINEALLWTFDSKRTLVSNSVPIYKHQNNSHSLLISTDNDFTPLYGWGVALAYPDLCEQRRGEPFLLNIVYVVNGNIKEVVKIPIVGNSKTYNLSKHLGLITVNINVNLSSNCEFSTVSAELVKK